MTHLLVNVHGKSRVQGLLRSLISLLQGRINHVLFALAVGVLSTLEAVTNGLTEEFDDTDVLQPVLIWLGLAVDIAVVRLRGRRHGLGLGGGSPVRVI